MPRKRFEQETLKGSAHTERERERGRERERERERKKEAERLREIGWEEKKQGKRDHSHAEEVAFMEWRRGEGLTMGAWGGSVPEDIRRRFSASKVGPSVPFRSQMAFQSLRRG